MQLLALLQRIFNKKTIQKPTSREYGFWKALYEEKKKVHEPLFVLAPMADVTDCVFREMIAEQGKPDVTWTEFVSADGLMSPGREVLKRDLVFSEKERPIVAQLFSANPEKMYEAAKLCKELGFDGIDINMGCPDRSIEKQGAGAAHIKNPLLAQEIISAAQRGAYPLPVTVKTRLGYNKLEWKTWLPYILDMNVPVITLHLRTRKELSLVPAHWELMKEITAWIRESYGTVESGGPIILGNGDVQNKDDGRSKVANTGCDGVMIGRGIFGTPWLFNDEMYRKGKSVEERLSMAVEHTKSYMEALGDIKSFSIMKKHYKAYVNGFDGAKELRTQMMEATNAKEVEQVVSNWLAARSIDA
jgi:nifR3 family TIM-barrel protein